MSVGKGSPCVLRWWGEHAGAEEGALLCKGGVLILVIVQEYWSGLVSPRFGVSEYLEDIFAMAVL